MKALRRINEALPGLVGCIIGYGLIALGIGMLIAPDKKQFASGLIIGIACAEGMAIHLAIVLRDSVMLQRSVRMLAAMSVIRYIAVVAVFFIMMYFHIGDLIAAFIGIFSLKIAAYIQQLLFHRRLLKENFEKGEAKE